MKISEKKKELYKQWTGLYDIDTTKIKYKKSRELREIEDNYYKRWKFFDGYVKAKEKYDKGVNYEANR